MIKQKNLILPLLLCCTLGLAPFFPEPHLWGKIKWIIGGSENMTNEDWLDVLIHGTPFIYLAYSLIKKR